jgi:hypothetical protein
MSNRTIFHLAVAWGLLGGWLVFCADGSILPGAVWAVLGAMLGLVGEPLLKRLFLALLGDPDAKGWENLRRAAAAGLTSWDLMAVEQAMSDLEGRTMKTWRQLAAFAAGVGLVHGLALGPFVGTSVVLAPELHVAAWQGALIGAILVPPFLTVLAFLTLAACDFIEFRPTLRRVRPTVRAAAREAEAMLRTRVGTDHLLLALSQDEGGVAARLLAEWGVSPQRLRAAVVWRVETEAGGIDRLGDFGPGWMSFEFLLETVRSAWEEARRRRHREVSGVHLLLVLLQERAAAVSDILTGFGVEVEALRQELLIRLDRGQT